MINLINEKQIVEQILKDNFDNYHTSEDPYEKIAVYKKNDNIIGLISYSIIYERAEINYIFVEEKERNNHIGSKLLEYALEDIKKHKINNISLEVNENNINAINLYKKYKFEIVSIRQNYYGKDSGYLMVKEVK